MFPSPIRHTLALAMVVALTVAPLGAQGVQGTVTTLDTGSPIEGALVELIPGEGQSILEPVASDSGGAFLITAVQSGLYILRVSYPGYRPQLASLRLRPQEITEVRVTMSGAGNRPTPGNRHVQGRVYSVEDGIPLEGVTVVAIEPSRSTQTDDEGRFILENVPRAMLTVAFQRIGATPDTVIVASGQAFVTVHLAAAPITLPAVEATARPIQRERFENVAQTSTVTIDRADVEGTPTLAEPDLVRTVQLLPGAVSKNDFYVGYNVRGGEVDQNLIRLDGITVFNPSHVGGMFSTFDEDALQRADLITGGFPARFGGRMSSVLDVHLRPGNADELRWYGHVSLLSSKLAVEGPVGSTGITYLFSGRRSYADVLANAYTSVAGGGVGLPYYFGDALGRITARLPTGGTLALTGYTGKDQLDYPFIEAQPGRAGLDLEFGWGNTLGGVSLRHLVGPVEFEQHANVSTFSTQLAIVPDIQTFDNSARLFNAGMSATWRFAERSSLSIGGDLEDYRMDLSRASPALETVEFDLAYRPRVWSGFADLQWEIARRLQIRPGVRVESVERGASRVVVSPRIAAKVFLTPDLALTGSAGRFYQAVHSIRDQDVPLTMFDFWVGADDLTPVASAEHLVVGVERWIGEDYSFGVEAYTKDYHDLVFRSFRDDPKIRGDEFFLTDGYARGFDVFVRKYTGSITGWIAYSYANTLRTTDTLNFPPSHDRRHTLNIVVQAPGPFRSDMGVRFGYGSPLPYTGIVGQWLHRNYNSELHAFDYSERESVSVAINGERFPAYARLDVGFRWRAQKWGGELRPYVQIVNVLNRQNVWVYAYDFDRAPPLRSGISQLPIFPTVGVEFAF